MGGFVEVEYVECKGIAKIKHSTTDKIYDIDGSELIDWECINYDEINPMYASTYECKLEHPDLGLLIWQCGHAAMDTDVGSHQLISDIKDFDIAE
jgi:hypothetical protein